MDSHKVQAFLRDILRVCLAHQMSLLPEAGTFAGLEVYPFGELDAETILSASFPVDDEAPETTGDTTRENLQERQAGYARLK